MALFCFCFDEIQSVFISTDLCGLWKVVNSNRNIFFNSNARGWEVTVKRDCISNIFPKNIDIHFFIAARVVICHSVRRNRALAYSLDFRANGKWRHFMSLILSRIRKLSMPFFHHLLLHDLVIQILLLTPAFRKVVLQNFSKWPVKKKKLQFVDFGAVLKISSWNTI